MSKASLKINSDNSYHPNAEWGYIFGDITNQLDLVEFIKLSGKVIGDNKTIIQLPDLSLAVNIDNDTIIYDEINNVVKISSNPNLKVDKIQIIDADNDLAYIHTKIGLESSRSIQDDQIRNNNDYLISNSALQLSVDEPLTSENKLITAVGINKEHIVYNINDNFTKIAVVTALPNEPDLNTIYFVVE